jgi:hypothetical protein
MRLILVIALCCLTGCATAPLAPLPVQPPGPTSESVVAAVGKQWDTADAKVSAAISIAKENADKPEVVRSETAVALSFLPAPEAGELAIARARAAKADQKDYAQAEAFGKKLLSQIDTSWLKVQADTAEALRVSQLKDARIVELTKAVEQAKKDAATNLWTLAGIAVAVLGAVAMVFAGPRIGATLLLSGAAIGAFPQIADSEYFAYIAGSSLALAAGLGIYWLWDHVRDSANASDYVPPKI